jgi:hypothetical protein
VSEPFGGRIPDEIALSRAEATEVLFALDAAIEVAPLGGLRSRLEAAARIIVDKLLPDLPDL